MENYAIIQDPFRVCEGELIQSNYHNIKETVFNWNRSGWPEEYTKYNENTVALWRIKSIKNDPPSHHKGR